MAKRPAGIHAVVLTALIVTGATWANAFAQKASVPKTQDKVALGENEVKQLLVLMDTDKNGKISKDEFMKFMEEEFARLDKDKSGELDARELTHSSLRSTYVANVGK